jgi:ELWxxDGT repeat protein
VKPRFVRTCWLTLALVAQIGSAQLPYLLSDLVPGNAPDANRHPKLLATLGSTLFFTVEEPSLGVELWISQGSAESTFPVADLCPGSCSGAPTALGVAGGRFYFVAHFSSFWSDLAVYSVLPSGLDLQRVLVQSDDVRLAFLESPYPQGYFAEVAGLGVFVAMLADGRKSLWSSSGSESDTAQFFEFPDALDDRFPYGLTQVAGSGSRTASRPARGRFRRSAAIRCPAVRRSSGRTSSSSRVRRREAISGSPMAPSPAQPG